MNSASQIGAFFDLDGTLLAPPSLEWRFIGYLLGRDEIAGSHLVHWLAHCAATLFRDPRAAVEGNKHYLAGMRESLVADWSNSHAAWELPFSSRGIARVAWHHAQQHQIVLVTGTLAPLARAIARQLPCPVEVCATELEVLDGHWTGQLVGRHMSAQTKACTIRAIAARSNLALEHSFAYGNELSDLEMLEAVGHAVAVNPAPPLANRARQCGWSILEWASPQAAAATAHHSLFEPEQAR